MIFNVSEAMHLWAISRKNFHNANTILEEGDSRGCYIGDLGEFAFSKALTNNGIEHLCEGSTAFHYDILSGDVKIDVKSKERTYSYIDRPKRLLEDECHVKKDQEEFDCNIYVFASVTAIKPKRAQCVQLMGWCYKEEYWDNCYSVRKGDMDGTWEERADAGKLLYSELKPMQNLCDRLIDRLTIRQFRLSSETDGAYKTQK